MRFDHNPTPPDFLGRRFQLRMLAMIGLLALVLVAIQFARRPSSWYWLTGRPRAAVPAADVGGQPVVHTPPRPRQEIAALVAIPPEELENIEDDSVGLRGEEIGPYHRILARARDLPQQDLDAMAGDAAFAVLQKQPDHFRGQLIAVAGDLRRLMKFPVRKNDEDITELFEALIFTGDSGTTPYRVRLTTRPVGLPFAESIDPPIAVRVVGYFFKRDQYIIEKDLRVHAAPLLLAQRIDRRFNTRPTTTTLPPTAAERMMWTISLLGLVAVAIAVTGLLTWRARQGDRRFAANGLKRATAAPAGAIEALDGVETTDPTAIFREMTEAAAAETDAKPDAEN
ncbi:MAG: hypothetical protein VB859_17335 [Planctomycetaceae bacterium]